MVRRIPHKIIGGVEHKKCCRCAEWVACTDYHKNSRNLDRLENACKSCRSKKAQKRYVRDRDKILKRCKEYQKRTRVERTAYSRGWVNKNRERVNKKRRLNQRKKRKNNPSWALKQDIGTRLNHILAGRQKCSSTLQLLGCSKVKLMGHLEARFSEYMKWSNRGKFGWHADHRVPCKAFDMSNELEMRVCWW